METNRPSEQGVRLSRWAITGAGLTGLAALCAVVGAVSVSDAAAGWREVLDTAAQSGFCHYPAGELKILGSGDDFILVCAAGAVVLLVATGVSMLRLRRWGEVTVFFGLVVVARMWLDAYAVSGAPSTGCNAVGLGGTAAAAIDRAGWMFFAAMIFGGVSWTWLRSGINRLPDSPA